ncbi:OmpA family protein [Paucibacter sp. PLA-PC-4]|uniref:OmpA family protein n=1 Tax=Paucibacter sp. PLA-PC-4 TaxID=2993655 RepID=UPI00224991C0|nr:OmpA family protein [Paucibacter sp. PLA-PC-4]MCX2861741.1 OmpA family protein [Paucibacter sp. PLA-PC-4]
MSSTLSSNGVFPAPLRLLLAALAGLALQACQHAPPSVPAAPSASIWTVQQAQAFRDLGFVAHGDGWELSLAASLLFEFNSEQLDLQQRANLQRIARALSAVGIDGLRIEGHSDNVGEADYNRRLSQRRAAVVAQVLAGAGMRPDRLVVRGFGMDKPIADNASETGRAQNRRVALIAPSS